MNENETKRKNTESINQRISSLKRIRIDKFLAKLIKRKRGRTWIYNNRYEKEVVIMYYSVIQRIIEDNIENLYPNIF